LWEEVILAENDPSTPRRRSSEPSPFSPAPAREEPVREHRSRYRANSPEPTYSSTFWERLTPTKPLVPVDWEQDNDSFDDDSFAQTPQIANQYTSFGISAPPIQALGLNLQSTNTNAPLAGSAPSNTPTMPMPERGSREAPKFDGDPRSLVRFLNEVDKKATTAGLTAQAKIDATVDYANNKEYNLWSDLPSKLGGDWDAFKNELIALYPGSGTTKKYFVSDLEALADSWRGKGLRTHADLGEFNRDFQVIVKWLTDNSKISDEKISMIYQHAFPHDQRTILCRKLEMAWPLLEEDTEYSLTQLKDAAKTVIKSSGGGASSSKADDIGPVRVKTESHDWKSGSPWDSQTTSSFANAIAMAMSQMNQGQQDQGRRAPRNKTSLSPGLALLQNMLCLFCSDGQHFIRDCPIVPEYEAKGLCRRNHRGMIELPNGTRVGPAVAVGKDLKERIDNWHKVNSPTVAAHFVEAAFPQASAFSAVINSADDSDDDEEESYPGALIREVEDVKNLQIFAVAAQQKADEAAKKLTEKAKTHNTRGKGKAPVNQASSKNTPAPAANASAPNAPVPMGQFKYQTSAENPKILARVMEKFLHGEVTLTTEEMLAASSELRKHT